MIRLEEKKIFFLKKIENSKHYREDILQLTINQNNCEVWFKERKKRLTASNFGRICSMRETTSCKQLVWNLLYNRFKTNMYIEHGIVTEPVAKKYLRSQFGIKVDDTGLFVDKDLPFLAASPGKCSILILMHRVGEKKFSPPFNIIIIAGQVSWQSSCIFMAICIERLFIRANVFQH